MDRRLRAAHNLEEKRKHLEWAVGYADERPPGRLLFPAEDGRMRRDIRGLLDRLGSRAGWKPGEIRAKMFRHTYCAVRLKTLDHGAPVGPYTVARELGHGSTAMVEKVYSHLGSIRHRSEGLSTGWISI